MKQDWLVRSRTFTGGFDSTVIHDSTEQMVARHRRSFDKIVIKREVVRAADWQGRDPTIQPRSAVLGDLFQCSEQGLDRVKLLGSWIDDLPAAKSIQQDDAAHDLATHRMKHGDNKSARKHSPMKKPRAQETSRIDKKPEWKAPSDVTLDKFRQLAHR
jgi:hypothetical protein